MRTEGCTNIWGEGNVQNDDTLFLTVLATPDLSPGFLGVQHAVQVAYEELVSHPIPGGSTGRRPLSVLTCNLGARPTPEQWLATYKHLIENVRTTGFIGPMLSPDVSLGVTATIPAKIPMIAPIAPARALTNLPDRENLLYRLVLNDDTYLEVAYRIVEQYYERVLKTGPLATVPSGQPMRVAYVRDSSATGESNAALARKAIVFNGKPALENTAGDPPSYREFSSGDPASPDAPTIQANIASQILEYAPHLIIPSSVAPLLITTLEANWPAGKPRPYYLGAPSVITTSPAVLARMAEDPTLLDRVLLYVPGIPEDDPSFLSFKITYQSNPNVGSDPKALLTVGGPVLYDAMYQFYYAMAKVGADPVPLAVGRALREVTDPAAPVIGPGPNDVPTALGILSQGGNINYKGYSGQVIYDQKGDNKNGRLSFACVRLGGGAGPAGYKPSGIRIDENYNISGDAPKCR